MKSHLKVKDNLYWVGALDFDIKTFDIIMHTEYGTTYNSYILKTSEKTVLFEISKETFFDEFIERVKSVTEPEKIDYVVLNHTEPDHSGSLAKLLELCPNVTIIGTPSAIKFAKEIANVEFTSKIVKDGETLNLGDKTLKFLSAPFLHWPDSMYSYVEEDKTLFTCDSFGCHYCSEDVFNDKVEGDFSEAYKYYFDCIMGPFKKFVLDAVNKIDALKIETICNGHGPVIRENSRKYIDMYREWATEKPLDKSVVIAYASSYGYTKKIAKEIEKGISENSDIKVHMFDFTEIKTEEILKQISSCKGILIGSATIVADTLPPVWSLLAELNPVIHKGKLAGVFGSYGWSGEAITNIEQRFNQIRLRQPLAPLKINFNPSTEQLKTAYDFGENFAKEIQNIE